MPDERNMQIAIMLYPGMTALDAIGPYEVLNSIPGRELRFVWKEVGPIVTDSGALVLGATHTFEETERPDLVLVPGGSTGTTTVAADGEVLSWLRRVHETTKYTTSVCAGSVILAAAGLLEGQPATGHWITFPALKALGAIPRKNERVVRTGRIMTAAGVSAGIDLALTLVGDLFGDEHAQMVQLLIEYDPQPPYDAGHIDKAPPEIVRRAKKEMVKIAATPRDVVSIPKIVLRRWKQVLERR